MHSIFNLLTYKLALLFLLLVLASFSVLAQQDEKAEEPEKPAKASAEKTKKTSIPAPISIAKQYKSDIKHYLPTNKIMPLLAGPDDYTTLVAESTTANSKGVALLIPDWQQGATDPKAINFLRKKLPAHGWTTIAIQPLNIPENYPSKAIKTTELKEENKAIIDAYKMKFTALMNTLMTKANEYPGIVMIIAQGNNGAMLVELLNQESGQAAITKPPSALVLLSSYLLTNNVLIDEVNTSFAKKLSNSEYPVLDLYLKHDNPIVLDKVKQRLVFSKKEMKVYYRQRQLMNTAIGYFPEQELITQINSWLKSIGW